MNPVSLPFSGATIEVNQITLMGPGFGRYPQGTVTFGAIPIDNAFEGATDGQGAILEAKPGEGVMLFGPYVAWGEAGLVRCSVRTEGPAAVTLAVIGDDPDVFVSTNTPDDPSYCQNQYRRLSVIATPPSTGFRPLLQIFNSGTETLKAYVDNLEVYPVAKTRGYHGEFLNGDEIDPAADIVSIPVDDGSGMIDPHGKMDRDSRPIDPNGTPLGIAIDQSLRMDFNGSTAEANQVSLQGAGFGAYPQAAVSFTGIPIDNAFEGATDGYGVRIEAQPGQGVMLLGPEITNKDAALLRCSVRTEGGIPTVAVAAVGTGSDPFTSVTYAAAPDAFAWQYRRISTFVVPPSDGFRPLLQVMNTSGTEPLVAYVDNLEVVVLDRFHYYWGEFLNGDETDPANGKTGITVEEGSNIVDNKTLQPFRGTWSNSKYEIEIGAEIIKWVTRATCYMTLDSVYYKFDEAGVQGSAFWAGLSLWEEGIAWEMNLTLSPDQQSLNATFETYDISVSPSVLQSTEQFTLTKVN